LPPSLKDETLIIFPLENFWINGTEQLELSPEVQFRKSIDDERTIGEQFARTIGFPDFSFVLEEATYHPKTGQPVR
jgi:hypothetical protein